MELRLYWQIVKKRLWLVAALVGLFALSYAIWGTRPPTTYSAAMRFTVGLKPELSDGTYYTYDRYYAWRTAEYLLDDLAEVIKSAAFAQDVAQLSGLHIPPGTIQGATSAGKLHRILTVIISWPDPDELGRISEASVHILQNQSDRYFSQLAKMCIRDRLWTLREGESIVREGEIVSAFALEKLAVLGLLEAKTNWQSQAGVVLFSLILVTALGAYIARCQPLLLSLIHI